MSEPTNLHQLLVLNEGRRRVVYDDATGLPLTPGMTLKGHPTIGIGRCLDLNGVTEAEINAMEADDVSECTADLAMLFPGFAGFGDARQAALIDMRFTLGGGGFRAFKDVIAGVRGDDWAAAATAALASMWARKEDPTRAKRDAMLLRTGAWPVPQP